MVAAADKKFMELAFEEAEKAFAKDEVPIGAVLVCGDDILALGYNTRETDQTPLAHAEMKVIQEAAQKKGDWRLSDCDLYVTLEPCPMCLGAVMQARVRRLIFAAPDPKRSVDDPIFSTLSRDDSEPFVITCNNHNLEVIGGIDADQSAKLLKEFFSRQRHT